LREDYAQAYQYLYQRHWWWRARERLILDTLRAKQPAAGWGKILDVGCGNGLFFDELLRFGTVEGVELSSALVSDDGPHRSRIHIGNFDRSLNLSGGHSLILMLDVLEHLTDPVSALRYALELLAADGKLLITVPAFNSLWTNHDIINNHVTRYTRASFRQMAHGAGLQIENSRYFFHWLYPVKMASRVV
jgi:2-polyprenyl-3-methyl-5-hydroxy-6-metoxy-1,4-benzoquinol methylase